MEIEIKFSFIAPDQDQPVWQKILTGLCNGEAGALFQERMLIFGTVVDEELEAMLDEWPVEYFAGQYWQENGSRFDIGLQAASDADQFAEELKALFVLCGVTAVEVELLGLYE